LYSTLSSVTFDDTPPPTPAGPSAMDEDSTDVFLMSVNSELSPPPTGSGEGLGNDAPIHSAGTGSSQIVETGFPDSADTGTESQLPDAGPSQANLTPLTKGTRPPKRPITPKVTGTYSYVRAQL